MTPAKSMNSEDNKSNLTEISASTVRHIVNQYFMSIVLHVEVSGYTQIQQRTKP